MAVFTRAIVTRIAQKATIVVELFVLVPVAPGNTWISNERAFADITLFTYCARAYALLRVIKRILPRLASCASASSLAEVSFLACFAGSVI